MKKNYLNYDQLNVCQEYLETNKFLILIFNSLILIQKAKKLRILLTHSIW